MKTGLSLLFGLSLSLQVLALETELIYYRPFTEEPQQVKTRIAAEQTALCSQQSYRDKREDAWRCQQNQRVLDPCFQNPNKPVQLICPKSPWQQEILGLLLAEPPSSTKATIESLDLSKNFPWALQLVTGIRCLAIDPGKSYDQLPQRFRCEDKSILFGGIQRCTPEWKMLQKTAQGVTTVSLQRVWF